MAGFLQMLTLLASGAGGVMFGFIADRIGRKRALMLSILTYSVCSFGSGLSTSVLMLAIFRFVLGLGMGGEWNTGATLVAETWPTELRAKALSIVQSSWAIGYALASLVAGIVLHYGNWRMVFLLEFCRRWLCFGCGAACLNRRSGCDAGLRLRRRRTERSPVFSDRRTASTRSHCCSPTSSECSPGGACSPGYRRSCRFQSSRVAADSESWVRRPCW